MVITFKYREHVKIVCFAIELSETKVKIWHDESIECQKIRGENVSFEGNSYRGRERERKGRE